MKKILAAIICFWASVGFAQQNGEHDHRRCGFEHANHQDDPQTLERLIKNEVKFQTAVKSLRVQRTMSETIYKIPVIVHVIHSGEAVGSGSNITAAQIYSQIEVLNEDFRRKNADASNTRSDFTSVAGDAHIEFVLAVNDPNGNTLAEPGIERMQINGHEGSWGLSEIETDVKPVTYWDPNRYANFWCIDLSGGILGYAQLPQYLNDGTTTNSTDGVVMGYSFFGSKDKVSGTFDATYNLGRTATHEVGHWLGLYHIWRSTGCVWDDEVDDTPSASSPNYGCPDATETSCSSLDMWENYMDYTDDECMNMFSAGQVERMRNIITLDTLRNNLVNSNEETIAAHLDLGDDVTVCDSYTMDAEFVGAQSYSWTQVGSSDVLSQQAVYTATTSGDYVVAVTTANSTERDTITLVINYSATADFTVDYSNSSLTADFTNTSTNADLGYEWDFGDGSAINTDVNPTHNYVEYGQYTATLVAKSSCGNDTKELFLTQVQSLTIDTQLSNRIEIYPNPNEGNFVLNVRGIQANKAKLMIKDVMGRALLQQDLTSLTEQSIQLNNIQAGVYLVMLEIDGKIGLQKIVVQ